MFIDWIACVVGLLGMYMVTKKNGIGFIVLVLSSLLWLVYAITIASYGMIVSSVIYAIVEIVGYFKWKKDI